MEKIYALILFLSVSLFCETIRAQVTVGSGVKPVKGAILDIKSQAADTDNVTSYTGGIVMPRLRLQSIDTMEPIIPAGDPDLAELKALHTGLMVYNLTGDAPFREGLYVWSGTQWETVLSDGSSSVPVVTAENGLTITPTGGYIELGGTLDANTIIDQNNNTMLFTSVAGTLSVNATNFIIKGGNTGIGKEPSAGQKLDISGDTRINGDITVEGETGLRDVEIVGTSSAKSHLVYTPDDERKVDKYLVAIGLTGQARWCSIGGLSSIDMEPMPTGTLRFNPTDASSQANYLNTGLGVQLPPGKWMISYSVRIVSTNLNAASTADIKPTSFRFTLLDNDVPIADAGTGAAKPYDDSRAYPDTYYNSCSGFFVVTNNSDDDKEYYLGIKTQELGLNWPSGDVELINGSKNDAYLVPIFMGN